MKNSLVIPADIRALYGSEVKYGYDKPIAYRNYQYRVDGQRLTYRQICESLPDVCPRLIRDRLHGSGGYFEYTLEQLSRPVGTISDQGRERMVEGGNRAFQKKVRGQIAAREHRAGDRKVAAAHKPVEGETGRRRVRTNHSFKPGADIARLQHIFGGPQGRELMELAIDLLNIHPAQSLLIQLMHAIFRAPIYYSNTIERPEGSKAKGTRHRVEVHPSNRDFPAYHKFLERARAVPVIAQEITIPFMETHLVTVRLAACGEQKGLYHFDFDIHYY